MGHKLLPQWMFGNEFIKKSLIQGMSLFVTAFTTPQMLFGKICLRTERVPLLTTSILELRRGNVLVIGETHKEVAAWVMCGL
jgi:hypothetical protein